MTTGKDKAQAVVFHAVSIRVFLNVGCEALVEGMMPAAAESGGEK